MTSRRYIELAYILLLPVGAWFIYPVSTFNNNVGFIDPWVYFGYVHNFQDLVDRYGFPYYAVRFGFIFPLIALVKLVGPVAGYVAFVYLMYLLAGVPVYLLFRKRFSVHAAILAYAILVSSVWFARAVLWTYPDASAVPYLVAAFALMLLEPKRRRFASFGVGVLIALAANSNIFTLSMGGLMGLAYLIYFKEVLWQRLRQDVPWMVGGFLLVFAGGSIGYYMCCGHPNFLSSTLGMIDWSVKGSGAVYQVSISDLLKSNYLYLLPFLLLSLIFVLKAVDSNHRSLCFASLSYLGLAITFYGVYELWTKTALFESFYYVSFLLAPSIMCVALIPVILARASNSESQLLNVALALFLMLPVLIRYGFPTILDDVPNLSVSLILSVTLLLIVFSIRIKTITVYAIVFFALSIQVAFLSAKIQGIPFYALMYKTADRSTWASYHLGLKFIETVPKFRETGRPIHFWYATRDPLANSLQSSYLWNYSRLMVAGKDTDGLPFLNAVNFDLLYQRSSLVLFDRDEKIVSRGKQELSRLGIRFAVNKTSEICENDVCYTIAVLDVKGGSEKLEREWNEGAYRPLNFDLSWSQPGLGAKVTIESTITSITTPPKAWSYGAVASIVFSERPPARRGLVRILLIVKDTSAGMGFLTSDERDFIKRVEIYPAKEPQELYFEFGNLSELGKLVVQTWNRDKSADVQILEFAVRG